MEKKFMSDDDQTTEITAEIVSAYVTRNNVAPDQLAPLIQSVYGCINTLAEPTPTEVDAPEPAVSIRKSLRDDHLVCLDCGKKFKSIKRHLGTAHGLTPEEYRERWGLRSDYPVVAPTYAATRSKLAKSFGLGRKDRKQQAS